MTLLRRDQTARRLTGENGVDIGEHLLWSAVFAIGVTARNYVTSGIDEDEGWNSVTRILLQHFFVFQLREIDRQPRHVFVAHVFLHRVLRPVAAVKDDFEFRMLGRDALVVLDQLGRELATWPAPFRRKIERNQFLVRERS